MDHKRLIISIIQLILSSAAFVVVTFAWFSLSIQTSTGPIDLSVSPGYIDTAELTYYTFDNIYRFDDSTDSIVVYDNGLWVTPTYTDTVDAGYPFNGIFINEYDPIIPENNINNFIFLELHLTYQVDEDKTINIDMYSDTNIGTDALNAFGYVTSRPYYLSEAIYIQTMFSTAYTAEPEGTNLFTDLSTDFEDTLTYPLTSFYGTNDTYATSYNIEQTTLSASAPTFDIYLYFKFSYYTDKLEDIITFEDYNVSINGSDAIRLFQDIKIYIDEDDSL